MLSQLRSKRTRRAPSLGLSDAWCSRRRRRARIESLERRCLLFAAPTGPEFLVNTFITGSQQSAAVASDADGDFVVAWQSTGQDGSAESVHAQRYSAAGAKQGSEFRVNVTTLGAQTAPAVAMDSAGNFIVAWQSAAQDGSGQGIYARRFGADGTELSGELLVNTTTANDQIAPAVAVDADGDFVVAWQSNGNDTSGFGIFARRFDNAGVAQGSEFQVNTYFILQQTAPAIAMDANGEFVVAWQSSNQEEGAGNGSGIYAQQFNSDGSLAGGEIHVNTALAGEQHEPAVAMNVTGDFVVAWTSGLGTLADVYAQRFSAAGTPLGVEFRVNTTTTGVQSTPGIASDGDGNFVVAWQNSFQDGSGNGIYSQQYAADGSLIGPEFRVNTNTGGDRNAPAVAADAEGNLVVAWQSSSQDSSGYGVYGQRLHNYTLPTVLGVFTASGLQTISQSERLVEHPEQIIVAFTEALSTDGGAAGGHSVTNPANWQIIQNGTDVSSQISTIDFSYNAITQRYEAQVNLDAPLGAGNFSITVDDRIENPIGQPLDGNADEAPGGDFSRAFTIVHVGPVGGEVRTDPTTIDSQSRAAVAMSPTGSYVLVWRSIAASVSELRGQLYDAAGNAQGASFKVDQTAANPLSPEVVMLSGGNFIVAWSATDAGTQSGVFARRFNLNGTPAGNEFRVNTFTTNNQGSPQISADASGNFVITWVSATQDGSGDGVYAQRYNATGVAQGGEFRVNISTSGNQTLPDVAMAADGTFTVVWSDLNSSHYGQYLRRYDKFGNSLSGELVIKALTSGGRIAMDAAGNFAVAWVEPFFEGSDRAVHARLFDAFGTPRGSDFLVQTLYPGSQFDVEISMDSDGDFVVVWDQIFAIDRFHDVFARRYNAAGVPQSPQFRVNTEMLHDQGEAAVAMDADGDFVVAWGNDVVPDSAPVRQAEIVVQRFAADTTGARVIQSYIDVPTQRIVVQLTEELAAASGAAAAVDPQNANWKLARNGVDISDQIASVTIKADYILQEFFAEALLSSPVADGFYKLTLEDEITDLGENRLDGDGDGVPGGDFVKLFTVSSTTPVAEETLVNTTTAGDQNVAEIAMNAAGDYVIVWQSYGVANFIGIYGQRFHADGSPAGGQIPVSIFPADTQLNPQAAIDAAGNFVVVWESNLQDGAEWGIYARRFDSSGNALSGEILVNTTTERSQRDPTIAMNAHGEYVIAWTVNPRNDGSGGGIYAQRFSSTGARVGGEFLAIPTASDTPEQPSVAMDGEGNFIVVCQISSQDGDQEGIYAQRYNADGTLLGDTFRVHVVRKGEQLAPVVAMNAAGQFVVAWRDLGVWARTFNRHGVALEPEFRVSDQPEGGRPDVAVDANGDFVVTWVSDALVEGNFDVQAKRFSVGGAVHGPQFTANTFTPNEQSSPVVAMAPDGHFVLAWHSFGQDGNRDGVYQRRYDVALPTTVAGDFDFDGDVDGADFCVWQTNFPTTSGATLSMGDADGDGDVDGADFVVWQTNFPTAPSPASVGPQTGSGSAANGPVEGSNNSAAELGPASSPLPSASAAAGLRTPELLPAPNANSQAKEPESVSQTARKFASAASAKPAVFSELPSALTSDMHRPAPLHSTMGDGLTSEALVPASSEAIAFVYATAPSEVASPPKRVLLSPAAVDYWMQTSSLYRRAQLKRLS